MAESFLLTNMAPQVEAAVRGWVAQRRTLTVITGPIFAIDGEQVSYTVIGDDHVAVLTHFFKIVVDANSTGHIEDLAFMIPKENLSGLQRCNSCCLHR